MGLSIDVHRTRRSSEIRLVSFEWQRRSTDERLDRQRTRQCLPEVQCQVRRQDCRLDVKHHQFVIIGRQRLKNVVAFGLQNHDALIEMMMLESRRRVKLGQWRIDFRLEGVVRAAMIEIVT
jgi:hypothetical protein